MVKTLGRTSISECPYWSKERVGRAQPTVPLMLLSGKYPLIGIAHIVHRLFTYHLPIGNTSDNFAINEKNTKIQAWLVWADVVREIATDPAFSINQQEWPGAISQS